MEIFLMFPAYSTPAIYPVPPNSATRDLAGLNLEGGYCYTPCNTGTPTLASPQPKPFLKNLPSSIPPSHNLSSRFRNSMSRPCLTLPAPCPYPATLTEAS